MEQKFVLLLSTALSSPVQCIRRHFKCNSLESCRFNRLMGGYNSCYQADSLPTPNSIKKNLFVGGVPTQFHAIKVCMVAGGESSDIVSR